jgi:hypothetical protein
LKSSNLKAEKEDYYDGDAAATADLLAAAAAGNVLTPARMDVDPLPAVDLPLHHQQRWMAVVPGHKRATHQKFIRFG